MSNINEYIYGSIEYAEVLRIVRQHLCSVFSMEYGAIAFYKFNPNDENAWVKVFPINPDIIKKHFPNDDSIKEKVLKLIYKDRNYKEFYYYKQFKEKYTTRKHFEFFLNKKEEQLEHSLTSIEGKDWSEFINSLKEYNILDQLFFQSNESKYIAIPVPILYSQAILIVVPQYTINNLERINKIIAPITESIHFYLFNRLLTELSKDLKPGQIKDKQELIERFLRELSQVAIPIKYEFNNKEYKCFDWYGNWKTESSASIKLTLEVEQVEMYMPTFCWHDGKMLHEKEEYKVREQLVVETIQNIFGLVFNYWQIINSKKLLVQTQISPMISELRGSVARMKEMKSFVEDELKEQTQKVENLSKLIVELGADSSQPFENEFYSITKPNGEKVWKIRYQGTDIILEGKDKGYEGLHYIMANKGQAIDVSCLGASGIYIQQGISDPDITKLMSQYKANFEKIETDNKGSVPNEEILKDYATNLAGYINCCKDSNKGQLYSNENEKLKATLSTLKTMLGDEAFREFDEKITEIAKKTNPNNLKKKEQDVILNPIRQLVNRLKEEGNGILAPLLDKSILKIGVNSSYKPKGELDIIWKFSESQTEL